MAVGRGFRHQIGAQVAAGTRAIIDDHRHGKRFGQFLPDGARHDVGCAAGRIRHDVTDGFAGVLLGIGSRQGCRQPQDNYPDAHGYAAVAILAVLARRASVETSSSCVMFQQASTNCSMRALGRIGSTRP